MDLSNWRKSASAGQIWPCPVRLERKKSEIVHRKNPEGVEAFLQLRRKIYTNISKNNTMDITAFYVGRDQQYTNKIKYPTFVLRFFTNVYFQHFRCKTLDEFLQK